MKKYLLSLMCLFVALSLQAQVFSDYFADKTLRIDYIFTGNAAKQEICLDGLSSLPSWAGRKHHLAELPLQGNGQIVMRNLSDGTIIYKTSFSHFSRNGLKQMKQRQQPKDSKTVFWSPIRSFLQK